MKLALGTVQFGLDYGISNSKGQVDALEVSDILKQAINLGIDTLDCAGAYGNSEQILGRLLHSSDYESKFNIISKIPALTNSQDSISTYFHQSLMHLKVDRIDALLFHQADNLLTHPKKEQLFQQLQTLKTQQLINRIGVSVYSPAQFISIGKQYSVDLIQMPLNIFDQRFISREILDLCQKKNIKLHARSLFLQGLLFLEQDKITNYFAPYKDKLIAFAELAKYLGCSKLSLALSIVAQELPNSLAVKTSDIIEKVVVGVCSTQQLTEIVNAYQQAKKLSVSTTELQALADQRLGFINPSLWKS